MKKLISTIKYLWYMTLLLAICFVVGREFNDFIKYLDESVYPSVVSWLEVVEDEAILENIMIGVCTVVLVAFTIAPRAVVRTVILYPNKAKRLVLSYKKGGK